MVSLPPPRIIELFYDGDWEPVSMREASGLTIKRGVSAEGSRAEPTTGDLTLDNRDGSLSPRDPNSSLYGKIGRNTPIRIALNAGGPYLDMTAGGIHSVSTPDSAALDVLGDIDVRIDVTLLDYVDPQMLAIRYADGGNLSWALAMHQDGTLIFWWTPTGSSAQQRYARSTMPVPAHTGERIVLRVTLDVDDGAGGCLAAFYTAKTVDAEAWATLGTPVTPTGTGTTSLFNATAALYIGDNPVSLTPDGTSGLSRLEGCVYGLQVRDGIDGTLAVDVDVDAQAEAGGTDFTDATGLVWSVTGTASLSNRYVRMVGEVPAWPPSRDLSGADRTVSIQPAGISRRLGAGNKPLDSALRRYIVGNGALRCWPLTDGKEATQGAELFGGAPMVHHIDTGTSIERWGQGTLADWIEPVLQVAGGTDGYLDANVAYEAAADDGWAVDLFFSGATTGPRDLVIFDNGPGTDAHNKHSWSVDFSPSGDSIEIIARSLGADSSSATLVANVTDAGCFDDGLHHFRLRVDMTGGDTDWFVYVDGVERDIGTYAPVFEAARLISPGWFNSFGDTDTGAIGYVTYWGPDAPSAADVWEAARGFPGESASERFLRLCTEAGVTASATGVDEYQTRLGIQHPQKFLDTLATCAAADLGYALEQRDDRALIYRARHTLYNQPPVLTLNFPDGVIAAPFRPLDDDKLTENDVTVQREGGSKGTAVLEEGRMSVQDPPDGVGRYDVLRTLSLEEDAQAEQLASWLMHVGTFDGLRYTRLTLKLGNPRVYAMLSDVLRADVGDKIRITNLPDEYGPGDVDLIIRGYEEKIGEDWQIQFNCTPGEPYDVLQLDSGEYSRLDTAGSELAGAIDTDDTTLPVVTTQDPVWIDSAAYASDFPFDVTVGGEAMTVTGIEDLAWDTFTRTETDTWGDASSGHTWVEAGGVASDRSVDGAVGVITLQASPSTVRLQQVLEDVADCEILVSITPDQLATGAAFLPGMLLRAAGDYYRCRLVLGTDASVGLQVTRVTTVIGGTVSTHYTYSAGTKLWLRVRIDGQRVRGKTWPDGTAEPGPWLIDETVETDPIASGAVGITGSAFGTNTNTNPAFAYDDFQIVNPHAFAVTRSVNGVVKSHTAGTAVQLARPVAIPL